MTYITTRPFNKGAYDATDLEPKVALVEIMKNLGYVIHGKLDEENYKKYDLNFYNEKLHKFLSFENEVRHNFDTIRDVFTSIHIPVRKFESQLDCYIFWKPDLTQVIIINRTTFLQYRTNIDKNIKCTTEVLNGENIEYHEDFIDIPKDKCKFYYLVSGYRFSDGIPNPNITGFLNYP